jgi:hypothetical protein
MRLVRSLTPGRSVVVAHSLGVREVVGSSPTAPMSMTVGLEGNPRATSDGGKGPEGPVSEGARPSAERRSRGGEGSPTAPMSTTGLLIL